MEKHVFIIGSRGYKYPYGGWESFVTNLILNYKDDDVKFYVPCLTSDKSLDGSLKVEDNVVCPLVYVPSVGFLTMFIFTIKATRRMARYIVREHINGSIMYFLGCKLGPIVRFWNGFFRKNNVCSIINPDGLEWKRDKWNFFIKKCFKISESSMIKNCDYCVCDSKSIKAYVDEKYKKYNPRTFFIPYGAYLSPKYDYESALAILNKYNIKKNNYYLIVGRFIPENNYETIIREFMKSSTSKDLVIISNVSHDKFYDRLLLKTNFDSDKRIKFIESVYDASVLACIRKLAYAYIHGHSAGGTNPSLLEALSQTDVNILYDVCYNVEVGLDSCFYFNKDEDNLKDVLLKVDKLDAKKRASLGKLAKDRIRAEYTWDLIVSKYRDLWSLIFNKLR